MARCEPETTYASLDLPASLQDLDGLLQADLRAIVSMVTTRAHERLFLTGREYQTLQRSLWNRLVGAINDSIEPLTLDSR